jgi:hypothetical protein
MSARRDGPRVDEATWIMSSVAHVIEGIFDTVAQVRSVALKSLTEAPQAPDGAVLDESVASRLCSPGQLAVGLGLVLAPQRRQQVPLRLEWWQVDAEGTEPRVLDPDLNPNSVGYYDYTKTEWFDVPRRTGRRHVVGPYVDVHGTGRYLLTLTEPVTVSGEFFGVVGADVSMSRFEKHLLDILGPLRSSYALLNDEGRVVLSTTSRWVVGDLTASDIASRGEGTPVDGVPWRLFRISNDGRPQPSR